MAVDLATISDTGGGGDYTSLSACEAGEQKDYETATNNGVWRYIEDFSDTTGVIIDGSSTSEAYDIKIEMDTGVGHSGKADSTKAELRVTSGHALEISDDYVTVEGLQIVQAGTGSSDEGIRVNVTTGVTISKCLIFATTATTASQDGIYTGNWAVTDLTIVNTIVYDWGRGGIHLQNYTSTFTQTVNVWGCTVYNCGGEKASSDYGGVVAKVGTAETITIEVYNTISCASGNSNDDYEAVNGGGTITWSGTHNASGDATANTYFTSPQYSVDVTDDASHGSDAIVFADITGSPVDLHLQTSTWNVCESGGTDRSVDYTDDIDGDTRSDWDIGADEITSDGAATLTVADATHSHSLDAVTLTVTGDTTTISLADLAHAHSLDAVALAQTHNVSTADLAHTQSLDAVALQQIYNVIVGDLTHGHALDAVTVTQRNTLGVLELAHTHTIDGVQVTQTHLINVDDLSHAHTLDGVDLDAVVGTNLVVADLLHGHAIDAPSLTQVNNITVADLLHGHTLDALNLAGTVTVTVADLQHTQSMDGVDVVQAHVLVVDDLGHTQQIGTVALTQTHLLALQELAHAQTLDAVNFNLPEGVVTVTFTDKAGAVAFTDKTGSVTWTRT